MLPLDRTGRGAVAGQPVVVLGYPTGLEAILAKAEADGGERDRGRERHELRAHHRGAGRAGPHPALGHPGPHRGRHRRPTSSSTPRPPTEAAGARPQPERPGRRRRVRGAHELRGKLVRGARRATRSSCCRRARSKSAADRHVSRTCVWPCSSRSWPPSSACPAWPSRPRSTSTRSTTRRAPRQYLAGESARRMGPPAHRQAADRHRGRGLRLRALGLAAAPALAGIALAPVFFFFARRALAHRAGRDPGLGPAPRATASTSCRAASP